MKLTILEVGNVPDNLLPQFGTYPAMFEQMFAEAGAGLDIETISIIQGAPLPPLDEVEAVLIPGSVFGVYDDQPWMEPLREFIRHAYAANIPMVGVCFGHQIIADALGGDVGKSEKGWCIGRHVYDFAQTPGFVGGLGPSIAIAASHQDQVKTPPAEAEVFLASNFTPNAGLIYKNGVTMSVQPHPEFGRDYVMALAEVRRGKALTNDEVNATEKSLEQPLQGPDFAEAIVRFLKSIS